MRSVCRLDEARKKDSRESCIGAGDPQVPVEPGGSIGCLNRWSPVSGRRSCLVHVADLASVYQLDCLPEAPTSVAAFRRLQFACTCGGFDELGASICCERPLFNVSVFAGLHGKWRSERPVIGRGYSDRVDILSRRRDAYRIRAWAFAGPLKMVEAAASVRRPSTSTMAAISRWHGGFAICAEPRSRHLLCEANAIVRAGQD